MLADSFRRFRRGRAGASLDSYGRRGEGRRWCPCAPRSGLPERRSVDAASGKGEGKRREGGREEAGRGVWMLVPQRRPACSQLLPECERRRERGERVGRTHWSPGWPIRRPSLYLLLDALTHTLLTLSQGVSELQNRVIAGRHFAFLGLFVWLAFFFNMNKASAFRQDLTSNRKEQNKTKQKKYPVVKRKQ